MPGNTDDKPKKQGAHHKIPNPDKRSPKNPSIIVDNAEVRAILGVERLTASRKDEFEKKTEEAGWPRGSLMWAENGAVLTNHRVADAHMNKNDTSKRRRPELTLTPSPGSQQLAPFVVSAARR
ncbi:MAG: hypothetical protein GDA36_05290 [Rhodobacteraceae bacterium]|nr:hypothetical protein [Paracoccaceae bacterium]